ncbi:craniofacial development protein 2-like [Palaemon carinicauda]|uniref:craniofacial development protein 2-like n=1 Tax=Palaemon carinicauda TaxID=392227 RepID=UPI0035B5DCCF
MQVSISLDHDLGRSESSHRGGQGSLNFVPVPSPGKWGGLAAGKASGHETLAKTTMISEYNQNEINARAFPVSDALGPRPMPLKNRQGLPSHGWAGLKRQAQRKISEERMRVATLNVGTMTGKGRELVDDLMEKRKIGVICVQETGWKGNNARELGEGCKLYYRGANMEGRNGVGIILSKELKKNLIGVIRKNDRILSLKLGLGATIVNVVCAFATQTGCYEEEKDTFWEEMDQELGIIPARERISERPLGN